MPLKRLHRSSERKGDDHETLSAYLDGPCISVSTAAMAGEFSFDTIMDKVITDNAPAKDAPASKA